MQIAIDGPAGAGKSTAAKALAREMGYLYLDTGAMYRAATLAALKAQTDLSDPEAIAKEVARHSVDFNPEGHVTLDGVDVEDEIRTSRCARHTSDVAPVPKVRERLTEQMRAIAADRDIVMDGRDIGSVVLPGADYKFFITATPEERARRRLLEMEKKGTLEGKSFKEIYEEIVQRDKNDSERETAPLIKTDDALEIVTDNLSPDRVVMTMRDVIGE